MGESGEFVDWFGRDHSASLRVHDGEVWYPKVDGRAERLAYLLGAGETNVAEVRPAPVGWDLGPGAVIVRIAQQYELGELPIATLDDAVAAELAFSLWIRRRDTHAFNRVYVEGVPVFFDHHIAFGVAEPVNRSGKGFLRDGPDGGYASRWRIAPWTEFGSVDTMTVRHRNRALRHALHPVADIDGFALRLRTCVDRFRRRDLSDLEELVALAGYRGAELDQVCHLVRASQRALPVLLDRVCAIIRRPVFVDDGAELVAG